MITIIIKKCWGIFITIDSSMNHYTTSIYSKDTPNLYYSKDVHFLEWIFANI